MEGGGNQGWREYHNYYRGSTFTQEENTSHVFESNHIEKKKKKIFRKSHCERASVASQLKLIVIIFAFFLNKFTSNFN